MVGQVENRASYLFGRVEGNFFYDPFNDCVQTTGTDVLRLQEKVNGKGVSESEIAGVTIK